MKNLQTVSKLPVQLTGSSQDYTKLNLPKSQEVVGRLISFGVRCTWTEAEMANLAKNVIACVEKAMSTVKA
jgi:8-amino-3,8-dideoxy-alpha-D-manno-octulosonate transaminase